MYNFSWFPTKEGKVVPRVIPPCMYDGKKWWCLFNTNLYIGQSGDACYTRLHVRKSGDPCYTSLYVYIIVIIADIMVSKEQRQANLSL